jgi:ATP-dependent DNA helicase RecQ
VVDEAHCILDWGEEFRPVFRELKQLRSVLPDAHVLALSATLSKVSQKQVAQHLLMRKYVSIMTIPTKENIRLTMRKRPGVGKTKSVKKAYDFVFESIFFELKQKCQDYPLTLIYCC